MQRRPNLIVMLALCLAFAFTGNAQIDDICRSAGFTPSLDSPFAQVPYVFGKVTLTGFDPAAKPPKVTVIFADREQSETRQSIYGSGNYCFKRNNGSGGSIVVEINGVEAMRRAMPTFGPGQQREDFEISAAGSSKVSQPGTVSAKFVRPQNPKTARLYNEAAAAERDRNNEKAIELLKKIVSLDGEDFIAWAKLGELLFTQNQLPDAEAAFRRSVELKIDYTPSWVYLGKLRVAQKQFEAAIEIFKHAISLEPESARLYQLLGEAYLQAKMGSLGAAMLNKALELDPTGMAECHLLLARLYDLAGAKELASREFSAFLAKVKEHPDRKKFEKYIKDNSGK